MVPRDGFRILTTADGRRWDETVRSIPGWDVYWLSGYARFWEESGDGEAFLAAAEEEGERLCQVLLRRRIPNTDPPRWDLTTPYGYGGYLGSAGAARLMPRYQAQLEVWCREHGIVSLFVRCHPLLQTQRLGLLGGLTLVPKGRTVYLDLRAGPPASGYKAEVRNRIRKARRAGLRTRLTPGPHRLGPFVGLYRETMQRLGAAPFYHFPDPCFAQLVRDMAGHLLLAETLLEEQVIASALFLYNDTYLHYHLGGSAAQWRHLGPNNLLFADAADWGREQGLSLMHLGGGLRSGDSLLRFKSGFSPRQADFYVGQQICDPAAYRTLTEAHRLRTGGGETALDYFPEYRAPAAVGR